MSYLLRLRQWLRSHPYFATFFGGALFVLSAAAAVIFRFSYFYSTFVIGMFLFFDALAHLVDRSISFTSNLERVNATFWTVLGVFIVATDLLGGQMIFTVWKYPPYHSWLNWALLYLIIYPVGGLSLIAMYRFFDLVFDRVLPGKLFQMADAGKMTKKILRIIFCLLPLAVIILAILYFSGYMAVLSRQWWPYFLLFLFLFVEWTFFFDVLIAAFGGRPILADFLAGEKKVILAIVISGLLGATLHELINTYVHEWVYIVDKFPVTTVTFLGVPVMVFITWIPLTIVCVQAYRFAQVVRDGDFFGILRREYFPN